GVTWSQGGSIVSFSSGIVKIVADPVSADTAYAYSSTIGVYKTTDGGITWAASNTGLPVLSVGVFAAGSDGSLYVTGGASEGYGIYESTNHGASWRYVSSALDESFIETLAVAPSNPEVIYASSGANIFESTDGTANWNRIPIGSDLTNVTNMAVSSNDPTHVFASSGTVPAIYVSTDSAATWTSASTGLGTP